MELKTDQAAQEMEDSSGLRSTTMTPISVIRSVEEWQRAAPRTWSPGGSKVGSSLYLYPYFHLYLNKLLPEFIPVLIP